MTSKEREYRFENYIREIYWNQTCVTSAMWLAATQFDPELQIKQAYDIMADVTIERFIFMEDKILLNYLPTTVGVLQLLYDKSIKGNIVAINNNLLIKYAGVNLETYLKEYGYKLKGQ